MTTRKYSSRSQQTTLAANLTDSATSCTVVSGSALLGGQSVPAGTTFTVVIDPDTALEEIVDVTVVSTNVLTITRGIESAGVGQAHSAGAAVRHMAIGRDFREANLHIEATGGYNDGTGAHTMHGIAAGEGDVVGTLKTQTLTNKTLTSPTITNPSISGAGVDASIVFEGATADAYETTLTVTDPTQDNTITLPNTTGTVVIANASQTLSNKTLGSNLDAGGYTVTNLATPVNASDAVRKDFADAQVAAAATSAASASTSAASAATSASSALTSANSAATSASSALTSANSAATSASTMAASVTAAASSATAAATSATSAAASATAAATSATSAAASATAAATSATSAGASASAAATSASSAAASAVTAANSVATIAGYATSAANSATAAATSATSAAASATAASTSATSASASATAASTSATSAATSASSALTSANSAAASAIAAAAAVTTAIQASIIDAKGDLIVGTANDTAGRLGVGTNGQILTADSAETTGLKWTAAPAGYTAPTLGTTTITSGTTVSTVAALTLSNASLTGTLTAASSTGTNGQLLTSTGTGVQWAAAPVSLPTQTGNGGKLLTTDGTTASWAGAAPLAQPTEPSTPIDGMIWVDTDGTALINQLLRWSKAPANGTTTLSGNDDNSVPLSYSVGYEQVFQNGALLARGSDYTATSGTSITLTNASVTGDIFEVFAAQPIAISDVYTQTQANAAFINDSLLTTTGDTIYASGANTPARLGIGTTGQVLTVSGGLPAWATPSAPSFIGCRAYASNDQNVANSTTVTIGFNNENFDSNGFHDNSTNNSRMTIPTGYAGKYQIYANLAFEGGGTSQRVMNILKNGSINTTTYSGQVNTGGGVITTTINLIMDLAVGDYLQVTCSQDTGSTKVVYGSSSLSPNQGATAFQLTYLGA